MTYLGLTIFLSTAIGLLTSSNVKDKLEKIDKAKAESFETTIPNVTGIYEYQSDEKDENHYIIIDREENYKGLYFGTEDGKGHGIFFFVTKMANLKIDDRGNIEFEVGERDLFETTQFKVRRDGDKHEDPIGHSRATLKYKGQIIGGTIKLTCSSEANDCWTETMTFERMNNGR